MNDWENWLKTWLAERLAIDLLSDIQRDKYNRRVNAELKRSYLAGRYYLLNLLSLYTNCTASEVELSYTRLNKPYLSDLDSQLEFNFTDTVYQDQYFGLFGFSRSGAIGVDIESRHRDIDLSKLMKKRFTELEQKYIKVDENRINKARGLSIWTRKEAYGKAICGVLCSRKP